MENKSNKFTLKKCLAVLISVLMIVSLLPMTVFADDTLVQFGE